jgi:hypothetical protein
MFSLSSLQQALSKDFWKSQLEGLKSGADTMAQTVADKCTELTGRETTKAEVKNVALGLGVAAVGLAALSALHNAARRGPSSGGGDFESQATMFFAENGRSLNYETPYVDSEGQIYS